MISIVIPVYREVDNIAHTTRKIDAVLTTENINYEIILVDDNSNDGTIELCEQLSRSLPIRLVVRKKDKGLSPSVIKGLLCAKGDILVVMDADLSHPPSAMIKMKALLDNKIADFVVGSRYVKGGSIDRDWSFFRRINSTAATLPALFLTGIKDPMSGFFAFLKKDLPDIESLNPIGYKIGLEILVKGPFKNIKEIPIHFSDRKFGQSKLSVKEQLKYLLHILRLYQFCYPRLTKILLYGAVGFSGFIVDTLFYFGFQHVMALGHIAARALSFWPAVTWGWAWHRMLTFNDRPKTGKRFQWMKFCLSSSLSFIFNWGIYTFLTQTIPFFQTHLFAAFITGILSAAAFNFTFSNYLVFPEQTCWEKKNKP